MQMELERTPSRRPAEGMGPALREAAAAVVRAPAAWTFAAVWLAAAAVLVASGKGFPVFGLVLTVGYLLLSLATAVAVPRAPAPPPERAGRLRLGVQVAVALVFAALTGFAGLAFHGVLDARTTIPLWTPLTDALRHAGGRWLGNDNYIANPVTYAVVPLLVLLLAGARLPALGFARGRHVGRVLLVWCTLPALYFVYALVGGQLTVGRLAGRLLSNVMQNGPWEEFLFRGVLQTRLRPLFGAGWALVLQALLFGAWHLGLGYTTTGHAGFLPALASTLVHQAVIGLAFGVIFERTRNIAAPSIVHVIVNSLG